MLIRSLILAVMALLLCATEAPAQFATSATTSLTVTPALTGSGAYVNGYCIGPLQTVNLASFTSPSQGQAMPNQNGSLWLTGLTVTDASKQAAAINLFIFDQKPTTTFADQTACTINSADYPKITAIVQIGSYVTDDGTQSGATVDVANLEQLGINLNLGSNNKTFYAVAMSNNATPTYTSTTALTFKYKVTY